MRRWLLYRSAIVVLVISVALVVWQGSFRLQQFDSTNTAQTLLLWAIQILIFVLMVTLGWVLARTGIKLYVERQSNREGSRIKTKLVLGALALSIIPVFCLVLFSYEILNHTMQAWFTQPAQDQLKIYDNIARNLDSQMRARAAAEAELLAFRPEVRAELEGQPVAASALEAYCRQRGLAAAAILGPDGGIRLSWGPYTRQPADNRAVAARNPAPYGASVGVIVAMPMDVRASRDLIQKQTAARDDLRAERRAIRSTYLLMMILITLFVISVTTWVALFLAKQITIPITALLEAARGVRSGDLSQRVDVKAADELGSLVRSFNEMTQELEASDRELDLRRRFNEAILESIPTGVISIDSDGSIRRVNRALSEIFPAEQVSRAARLEDLFSREDTTEIKYLMKRARRAGAATRQLELRTEERKLQLAVTVSALEEKLTSGFVVVLEDTTELLRAQKAEAWREVARRVAHEIKNPLTPITLCAERIIRQLGRMNAQEPPVNIVKECAETISRSVESVKTLVDEFSQFARFPTAQLARADLNEVVRDALTVFQGRLGGIEIRATYTVGLPPVNLDREQFQRAVINLVDNAAEAMQDSLVKQIHVATQHGAAETVELVVADTGCGVSAEDKEKLFLPYFSTKNRGTGLGLAIVSHIVAEHNGQIRVEDNKPIGARFTVEIPAIVDMETENASPAGAAEIRI